MILPEGKKTGNERLIYQRREQDQNLDRLSTKLKQEFYQKEFASWENKGREVKKAQYVKDRLDKMREQSQQCLQIRQNNLACLLQSEHQQYKQEIADLEETQEQIRQKMIDKVTILKENREVVRKEFVEKQQERAFNRNADELRKVNQEFLEMKTTHEQNVQIMEKQKLLEQKYYEEMIYAELYKRDIKKKETVEKLDLQQKKEKIDERNNILGIQIQMNDSKRDDAKQQIFLEKQMLKSEWSKDDERFKQQKTEKAMFNKQIHDEIAVINEQQKSNKDLATLQEKFSDKEMVKRIIEKEQALDRLEGEKKVQEKEESKKFMMNFKNRAHELNAQEEYLEQLIKQENTKQWEQRQSVWNAEDAARRKLMIEVYDSRQAQVERKKNIRQDNEDIKLVEKDELTKDIALYVKEVEQKKINEIMTNKNHQGEILDQCDVKTKIAANVVLTKQQDEQQAQQQRHDYANKIIEEKQRGKDLLVELRKKRPF